MLLPNGKTTLVDTSQAECFNLSVLKRMDEDILEILYSATHVAVYEFDTARKSWRRSDIEGTLFLVKRCSAPRFRMIVVNSKGIDNFTEEVDGSLECEVLQTFLLYTKGNNQLYGIWFYDEKNCEEFGNYLKRIIKGMPKTSPTNTPRAISSNAGSDFKTEVQNIFSQLNGQQITSTTKISPPTAGASNSTGPTGESEHLMRLFLQAKERGAPSTTTSQQLTLPISTPPVSLSLQDNQISDTVLTSEPMTSSSEVDIGPRGGVVDPGPSSLTAVPLPPDFFKPSTDRTPGTGDEINVVGGQTQGNGGGAPDPVNLPMPEAVTGRGINLGLGLSSNPAITTPEEDNNLVPSSLARFFAKTEEENNTMTIDGSLRDRFRQALINLLSNDDTLDILIAEFKKVGIPIQ